MPNSTPSRWARQLLKRFNKAAKDNPFLGHVAVRSSANEWPYRRVRRRREASGFTTNDISVELGQGDHWPIAFEPHWLWIKAELYQGFYLFRQWRHELLDEAEQGVRLLRVLNEEACTLLTSSLMKPESTDLPVEIQQVDLTMSAVYEIFAPAARSCKDMKVLEMPGNLFSGIARVLESIINAPRTDVTQPDRTPGASPVVAETSQEEKPSSPTSDYCLRRPIKVRWEGEKEIQQRLWHLLKFLLDNGSESISFEDIDDAISSDKERGTKPLQNDISALNKVLSNIGWPVTYSTKSGYVIIDKRAGS